MKSNFCKIAVSTAALFALASVSHAAPTLKEVQLGGTTQWDVWNDLTAAANPGYGGFPGSSDWPGPIQSQEGDGTAGLIKVANGTGGGPYPSGGSIYYGGMSGDINNDGGTLAVQANAISGLSTIIFQVCIGEAWGYDFYNGVLPTLNLNTSEGEILNIEADYTSLIEQEFSGTVDMPTGPEDVYTNLWGLQWDVSDIEENIASFSIEFTGVQHAQLYSLQLNQSSMSYGGSMIPVPEPSTWALMAGGGVLALTLLLRRRKAALFVA